MMHSKTFPTALSVRNFIWFLCLGPLAVIAFPTGPGSCVSPNPLMGSLHMAEGYVGGTELSDFGLEVRVDGMTLTASEAQAFSTGYTHFLELVATKSKFKGALFKIYKEGLDTTEFLTTEDPKAQVLSLCTVDGTSGVGHVSNDAKDSIYSYLRSPFAQTDLILEVTAVIENDDNVSRWYHSMYILNAVSNLPATSLGQVITNAPIPANPPSVEGSDNMGSSFPSSVPSMVPSGIIPSGIPSELPSGIPSEIPSGLPSLLPSIIPSTIPSSIPSGNMGIFIPGGPTTNANDTISELPSAIPSGGPSMIPSSLPSTEPSALPSSLPSAIPLIGENMTLSPSVEDVFASNEGALSAGKRGGLEGMILASILGVVGVVIQLIV